MAKPETEDAEAALERLQVRMLQIQQACYAGGQRAIVVFEGIDAAGKGGAIKRLIARMDPRGVDVRPIGPPDAQERGHHYLYRFWLRLPAPGRIAIFDRSWYGRVLVERVEKLASKEEWKRAYEEINRFEKLLIDDGARLVKIFLRIGKKEQLQRFRDRALAPHKRWKLSESDLRAHRLWDKYQEAYGDMLARTSVRAAPWHVIDGEDKEAARLEVLRVAADTLGAGLTLKPAELAKPLRAELEKLLGEKLA